MDKNKIYTNNLISICIVTQNNYDYIKKLLNSISILYQDVENVEIVIVDNNSDDNTTHLIENFKDKTHIPLTYVYRERRFSLPENRNLVVKKSKGKIIVMIDSDVEFIDKKFFDIIREIFQSDNVSLLSPLIISSETKLTQSLGLTKIFRIPYLFKFNFPQVCPKIVKKLTNDRLIEIQMLHGACFIFRKSLCQSIGCFDEFMEPYNFDEMDFAIRAYMNKFKIFATSKISIIHYGGGTTSKFKKIQRAELFISHGFRSIVRNYEYNKLFLIVIILIFFIASTYELSMESKKPIVSIQVTIKSLIWAFSNRKRPLIKSTE